MQLDFITVGFAVALALVIFSPLLFRKTVRLENGKETKTWIQLFASKWFGATFIFILLFGNYSEFTLEFFLNKITLTVIISFFISILANVKLIFTTKETP